MEIAITQQHIDQGLASSPSACPISLAVEEVYPEARCVLTHQHYIEIGWDYDTDLGCSTIRSVYEVDESVKKFIVHFDRLGREYVNPGVLTLNDKTKEASFENISNPRTH